MRFILLALFAQFFLLNSNAGIDPITDFAVSKIVVLNVDATINPAVAKYIQTEVDSLSNSPESLMVLKINTPGGLVTTTKDIITTIGKSSVPVIIWVAPEGASATSAGAIIASAAHGLVMSPGSNIGAATPIGLGGDIKESDGRSKAINDITALVRSLSQTRARNAEAFASMISSAASYTSQEAAQRGIIDGIVNNLDDIRKLYHDKAIILNGQKRLLKFSPIIETVERPMDTGLTLLNIFANPSVAYILFILGAGLIYFELQAPGGYIAGGIGLTSLIVSGIAFQVLPLNLGAAALLITGVVLLVLEIYVTSYGLLSVAALISLFFGSVFLFHHENGWMTVQYSLIYSTIGSLALFIGLLAWYFAKHKVKKENFFTHSNQEGVVVRELSFQENTYFYQIKIGGEIWKARSETKLMMGDAVKVISQSDTNLELIISKS
ncbi:MAG: ATP-dependent Clp protease proteolytic subunit [Bacteriovoracaceae bacterium]|nr:ATP-dependent Clp protease proteolytic subunit [Bacteriovoracaceae bacterium]